MRLTGIGQSFLIFICFYMNNKGFNSRTIINEKIIWIYESGFFQFHVLIFKALNNALCMNMYEIT